MQGAVRSGFTAVLFLGAAAALASRGAEVLKVLRGPGAPPAYAVAVTQGTDLQPAPELPDVSGFTAEKIAAMQPALKDGRVTYAGMDGAGTAALLLLDDAGAKRLRLAQREVEPKVLVIESGRYDLPGLLKAAEAGGGGEALRRDGAVYTLRAPLVIRRGAGLNVAGEWRLSAGRGAMVVNEGELFIVDAAVTGWSEAEDAPAAFKGAGEFRPFISSWSGGRLFVAGSRLSHLGYESRKAYGLTYTTCAPCLEENPGLPAPTGAVVDSVISGLYFGFYSYEAEGVAVVGNTFDDNVVYGIDPHDRSTGLVIAGNEVKGTRLKHGIILSRGVSGNWIFNNNSHHNKGAGLMLDFECRDNVIAGNTLSGNGGDGIFFAESAPNRTHANKITGNGGSGVRMRNSPGVVLSGDGIFGNKGAAVAVYAASLEAGETKRDLATDAYERRASATLHGLTVRAPSGAPAFRFEGVEKVELSNIRIVSGGSAFAGISHEAAAALSGGGAVVTLRPLEGGGP